MLTVPEGTAALNSEDVRSVWVDTIKHPSRRNTPWRRMSSEELSRVVAEASGHIAIGFKAPGTTEGGDDFGRVLVADSVVRTAKIDLRLLGVEFHMEPEDMPYVVATIPANLVQRLRAHPLIEYVEPILFGEYLVQDTTWNVQRVQAPPAWPYSTGAGAKLLILDSGIQQGHPDLAPAVIGNCDGSDGLDRYGHGTQVAGVGAAVNNALQVIGVAHGVALWTSKIGEAVPSGDHTTCGVRFGITNGADVINISAALSPLTILTDEINRAYYQHGIVVVAAAGNTGGSVTYPATLDAVIAVSATDANNNLASFSARGSKIEIAAPGKGVITTCLSREPCSADGTSFAAPHVAAAAAILKAQNPGWSAQQIRQRLTSTATDLGPAGRDSYFGYGLLNIAAAVGVNPPPSVTISGPTYISQSGTYTWTAQPSGGDGSYTYQWYERIYHQDGMCRYETPWAPVATGKTLTRQLGRHGYDFQFYVDVQSAGQTASAMTSVYFADRLVCPESIEEPVAASTP